MPRLKQPSGTLYEEYITSSAHFVKDGHVTDHDHNANDGTYTGRMAVRFKNSLSMSPLTVIRPQYEI